MICPSQEIWAPSWREAEYEMPFVVVKFTLCEGDLCTVREAVILNT